MAEDINPDSDSTSVEIGDVHGDISGSIIAGGDVYVGRVAPISYIEEKFASETSRGLQLIQQTIPGLSNPLPRDELLQIDEQLAQGKPVLVVGEAGVGKSGIAAQLARDGTSRGKNVLYLDSRRLVDANVTNATQLREHFDLQSSLNSAIARVGQHRGCRLIIDQLDNTAGHNCSPRLIDLAVTCAELANVEVIVLSRAREADEEKLLHNLTQSGFVRLTVVELRHEEVVRVLHDLGIASTPALAKLGANLLNLDLIARIQQVQPDYDFSQLMDEVLLWAQYIEAIKTRESEDLGKAVIAEAVALAAQALREGKTYTVLSLQPSRPQQRLISWGIIVQLEMESRVFQFRHEELRDYLYAWDATAQWKKPSDVLADGIDRHLARNVVVWMDKIYGQNKSSFHTNFLREIFDV